jgi:hypothetical protein
MYYLIEDWLITILLLVCFLYYMTAKFHACNVICLHDLLFRFYFLNLKQASNITSNKARNLAR